MHGEARRGEWGGCSDGWGEMELALGRATKLQSVFRGHRIRRRVKEVRGTMAALRLQTAFRGHMARHAGRDKAARSRLVRRLQATFRGHRTRQRVMRERGEAWAHVLALQQFRLNPRRGARTLSEGIRRMLSMHELPGGPLLLALTLSSLVPGVDA